MPSEVRFTRAQKWDLIRLSAAAVASTVFFTVPIFLAHRPEAVSQVDDRPPASAEVATPGSNPPESTGSGHSKSPSDTADVSVVTSLEFALVTTPAMESSMAATRARTSKPAQLRARANTGPSGAPPSSLGRRVVRFIAGSGKYNVRPFPTIATSGS